MSKSDSLNDWEKLVEFPALGQQMLGGDEDLREQAIARYEKGDRSGALPLLEAYIAGLDPEDDDYAIRILIGKIYLSDKKDYPKAGEAFNAVLQSDAMGPFKTEARFNIALMEFAKGNREQARELFRQLSTEADETWRAKAETALKELF